MKDLLKSLFKFIIYIVSVCVMILLINVVVNQNIVITTCRSSHYKITEKFNGYKILQLTDIHSIRNTKYKDKLINKVKELKPDSIFITGDLIDSEYYQKENEKFKAKEVELPDKLTIDFVEELTKIASVYMVYGNHEMMLLDDPENNVFKVALENLGVNIINNKVQDITIDGESIRLIGIQDPATLYKDKEYADVGENNQDKVKQILDDIFYSGKNSVADEKYTILLSHRPEYFKLYTQYPIDIALTGHTHGGIVSIPGVGGLYAHPQGWFPAYSRGVYKAENFQMLVGVGLGYSKIPLRIFNPPEIVELILNGQ